MMLGAVLADVPESHFQAAWYYSIIIAAIAVISGMGGAWALAGARRVWRSGDRAAASVIAGATIVTLLIFIGFLLAAAVGLIASNTGQT
jgi:uncharacterized membrane protein YozB (DUF420 family)